MNSPQELKGLQKVGGASLVGAGVLYLLNFALLSMAGQPPSGGQLILRYLYDQRLLGQTILPIFLVIDVLLIVGVSALYFVSQSSGTPIVVGTVLGVVALTVDLVITVVTYSLLGLSISFAAATTEGQRIAYGATAELAEGMTFGFGQSFFFVLFSISIFVVSVPALKFLGKSTGYLGIAAGLLGIAGGLVGVVPLIILWPIWFLAVGYGLLRKPMSMKGA